MCASNAQAVARRCSNDGVSSNGKSCPAGTYCKKGAGTYAGCTSCYECYSDADVIPLNSTAGAAAGSCTQACGTSPRTDYSAGFGLPYSPGANGHDVQSEWLVPHVITAAQWFASSLGKASADTPQDFARLLSQSGFSFMPAQQLQYARLQMIDSSPMPSPAIAPPDFVRTFVLLSSNTYNTFCPPDNDIFASGASFPGCACMVIPTTYQQDGDLVNGINFTWVGTFKSASGGGGGGSVARADCPEGFRCSSHSFQLMRLLLARQYLPPTLGICTPCVVGEYCPAGTVEKTQVVLDYCNKRSAIYTAIANQDDGGNATGDGELCYNTMLCPAGSYCPEPYTRQACPAGAFCTQGTTSGW